MKVLVGVDGSSNSLATVAFVGQMLSVDRDELILSYVSPDVPFVLAEEVDPAVAVRAKAALSAAVFDEAVARLPAAWQTRAKRVERSGPASALLLAAASEQQVDAIAVGFRGAGLLERFMLGSVSRAIVESAKVPVLVVKSEPVAGAARGEEQAVGATDSEFRALVAYDGSQMGERIAAALQKIAWPRDTRGWVMTVVRPMYFADLPPWLTPVTRDADVKAMADAWQKEHEQQTEQAGAELREFQKSLPAEFQTNPAIVAEGRASEKILATLAEKKIELAIVGSRGRGTVAGLLLGSTSDEVIARAPCSVLIIR
jgi:nucleotide-binding universal stress UspA family protein